MFDADYSPFINSCGFRKLFMSILTTLLLSLITTDAHKMNSVKAHSSMHFA